jgi:hypothetical protein
VSSFDDKFKLDFVIIPFITAGLQLAGFVKTRFLELAPGWMMKRVEGWEMYWLCNVVAECAWSLDAKI